MSETLEDRWGKLSCSNMKEHELSCKQVVAAAMSSYQVAQCLVCSKWIMSTYQGELKREISSEDAYKLISGHKIPVEYWWEKEDIWGRQ